MIAITGGSGFIGSHIVDKLLQQGSQVRILDPRLPHRRDVEYSATDVTDLDALCQGLKGTSAVFHLAAVSNVNVAFREPIATVKLNDLGTVNVLEAARRNDLERVFFASTVWVYAGCREEQVDEETPSKCRAPATSIRHRKSRRNSISTTTTSCMASDSRSCVMGSRT